MARYYGAVFGDKHRIGPAPLANRSCDLTDLCVTMGAGVAGKRDQPLRRPALNVIRRPGYLPCRPGCSQGFALLRVLSGGSLPVKELPTRVISLLRRVCYAV